MTLRQIFESVLIELGKIQAPTLKLYEFNYLCNKAVNQFVNKIYNIYDINQQTSDDLRVLKQTCTLQAKKIDTAYEVELPLDYLHLLNCICVFQSIKSQGCIKADSQLEISATRLTADVWGEVMRDVYNRPSYKKPYFYIHNAPNTVEEISGIEEPDKPIENFPRTFKLNTEISAVEKPIASRIGNPIPGRCEIRYGSDSLYVLKEVKMDYLKVPQHLRLTQQQVDLTKDTSQIMEFPDYICQEIINELVLLVMGRSSDPRLTTNLQITQSIARPTQQQQ